jgi:hypothetical protein
MGEPGVSSFWQFDPLMVASDLAVVSLLVGGGT